LQDLSKFIQIGIFGLKIYHLATLDHSGPEVFKMICRGPPQVFRAFMNHPCQQLATIFSQISEN
jgi:hypothetical protein